MPRKHMIDDEEEREVAEMARALMSQLREARIASLMTSPELAAQIGVTRNTLSLWENGHSSPPLIDVARIASKLGHRLTLVASPSEVSDADAE